MWLGQNNKRNAFGQKKCFRLFSLLRNRTVCKTWGIKTEQCEQWYGTCILILWKLVFLNIKFIDLQILYTQQNLGAVFTLCQYETHTNSEWLCIHHTVSYYTFTSVHISSDAWCIQNVALGSYYTRTSTMYTCSCFT